MEKKYTYTFNKAWGWLPGLFILIFLFSCSADDEDWQNPAEEIPMQFDFLLPDDGAQTRVKSAFSTGDKIYITATVTCKNEFNGVTEEVRSSILKYDGSKFNPDPSGQRLMWPADAVSGRFVAYYYPKDENLAPGTDAPAPTEGNPVLIHMSDLRESTDDLLMAKQEVVSMNGVVLLRFAHTTTKLRFHGLSPSAKYIELSTEENFEICNQIELTYSAAEGYNATFKNDGNPFIKLEKPTGIDDGKGTYTRSVFFLNVTTQWQGKKFKLTQYNEANEKIKETPLTEDGVNLHNMRTGRAYYISFYSGTNNKTLEEENEWYETKQALKFDNVEHIQAYFAGEGKDGLTRDLDFNNLLLDDPAIVFPQTRSITLGSNTFNGNYYAIRNVYVKNGLFGNIPAGAKIINLRLENVKVIADGEEGVTAAGLLSPSNSGTIENVRISGNNSLGTKGVQYVGGLVGENNGTITKVQISGSLTIDPYIENNTETTKVFAVGGLIGYNNGSVSSCEINAGSLIKPGGEYRSGEMGIGGMIGYHSKSKTVTDCNTYTRIDGTQMVAKNSYIGGFCGINRGTLTRSESSGEVKGALFIQRSGTGGFLGYTTSLTEKTAIAVVNGCGATGNVYESDGTQVVNSQSELYTGGFCGFSEIDLKNVYSVGMLNPSAGFAGIRKQGALTGLISADKTIYNSFSITQKGSADLPFNGEGTCKTQNAHYRSKMITEQGVVDSSTNATVTRLNNAVSSANGYWNWNYSASIYGGAPYLVKK